MPDRFVVRPPSPKHGRRRTFGVPYRRPLAPLNIVVACGWEDAAVTTHWTETNGPHTLDSTINGRTGTNALRIDVANDTVTKAVANITTGLASRYVSVDTFRFQLSALPTGGALSLWTSNGVAIYNSRIIVDADNLLYFSNGGTLATGPAVAANTWYRIDVAIDGANRLAKWALNRVPLTDPGAPATGDTHNSIYLGKISAIASGALSVYFDDFAHSETFTDYPIPPGVVLNDGTGEQYVRANEPQTATPDVTALVATGLAPTVTASNHQTATPGVASLTLTPFAPTVSASDNQTATPGVASLSTSTFAPTVTASDHKTATPGVVALTLTTFAPTVTANAGQTATPDTASLALTGLAPTVSATANVTATPGTLALTTAAFAPTVSATDHQLVTPDPVSLALTGLAPTVTVVGGSAVATPGTAALVLTAYAPEVTASGQGHHGANLRPGQARPRRVDPVPVLVSPAPAHLRLVTHQPDVRVNDDDLVLLLAS